ncbi:hypothetical protein K3725_12200 [Leisingera sp. S132]|uniref:hypothetical protein n=1 Tax=Leisingera sp. S132 TaxID=2867016 RepID=UPI0021A3981F|nr:hypothetical protein [Leisingera sp. S132]UWQ78075.1 hypothetical protein K3725_12200 [Leisingera sp. S132]
MCWSGPGPECAYITSKNCGTAEVIFEKSDKLYIELAQMITENVDPALIETAALIAEKVS